MESRAKPAFWGEGRREASVSAGACPPRLGLVGHIQWRRRAGQRPQTDGADASAGQNTYNRSGGATFIERRQRPTPPPWASAASSIRRVDQKGEGAASGHSRSVRPQSNVSLSLLTCRPQEPAALTHIVTTEGLVTVFPST